MLEEVRFVRGLSSQYDLRAHYGALYFATDTRELILNGTVYGIPPADNADVVELFESLTWMGSDEE